MSARDITARDRAMAKRCLGCPVCGHARKKQRGLAFFIVKNVESGLCPFCRAYERVYGRKAHQSLVRREAGDG